MTSGAALLGTAALIAAAATVVPASADDDAAGRPTARHEANGSVRGVMDHLIELEEIGDRHGGRASGTPGYEASRDYVVKRLSRAGYRPQVQEFDFPFFQQLGPSSFEVTAPTPRTFEEGVDFSTLEYSGAGDITAPVEGVDLALVTPADSTSGCEDADFAGFTAGNIALVQRGVCTFGEKATNALEAGAVAVIVMNQGNTPERSVLLENVTLGGPVGLPVIGVSFADGQALDADGTIAHVVTDTQSEIATTWNVTAETRGSRQNVVMAGAHLDSVVGGNGINDNGSGSAALLETAEAVADMKRTPNNKVRFAWWGAEENGLLGSEHYVAEMAENQPGKFQNIALYLNFDMVGSPNYMLGVYDGNNDAFPPEESATAPEGSAAIEKMYARFFDKIGTGSVETAFSGRSDYGPFIALNVPAGGLFTGAEGVKSEEEAELFGGTAGEAYDSCYHQACDDLGNVSRAALKANTAAIMHSVTKYARSTRTVNGDRTGHEVPPAPARSKATDHHHGAPKAAR
ncbi:M20/M25/M40 family metallo-hydrolase [Nocardioides euryhalodurans]|uniref:M20/M25/M40 family metallo-hydrolase n=1 Tax=Nocardioides euryhalodurans TaxID=2518370 RepID=A0A4P7GN85_9ACTN|nr:M20/M25/M40 family metallo-hydrolase [Nocardioides euryhalodurans]QBR93257.1 M20/M25/M40 family metallo-hydrolase [Nocardioides euryhalodurans]